MKNIHDKPYRVTIEQYEYKYSIEVDYSDIDFSEYLDLLRQISLAAGWSAETVDEFFDK